MAECEAFNVDPLQDDEVKQTVESEVSSLDWGSPGVPEIGMMSETLGLNEDGYAGDATIAAIPGTMITDSKKRSRAAIFATRAVNSL